MNTVSKVLVVVVLVLSAAFAVSQMMLHGRSANYGKQMEDVRSKLTTAQDVADTTTKERNDSREMYDKLQANTSAKIDELTTRVKALVDERTALSVEKTNLQDAYTVERAETTRQRDLSAQKDLLIGDLHKTRDQLSEEVRAGKGEIASLEDKLRAQGKQVEALEATVADLTAQNRDLASENQGLARMVARAKELVPSLHLGVEAVPIIDGTVVRVPEAAGVVGAVVINRGSKDGVKVNIPFTIFRDSKFIARVNVQDVQETLCIALVERGMLKEGMQIQVGDSATSSVY